MENKQATELFVASWRNAARFAILDTEFGAGSIFFAAWTAWRTDPFRCAKLHYLAIVKAGASLSDLLPTAAASIEFSSLAEELLAIAPPIVPGFHRVLLDGGSVSLTLIVGEQTAQLAQIKGRVDAFILDAEPDAGAARLMARLAAPGAILMGAEISDEVRRVFEQAGFLFDSERSEHTRQSRYMARFAPRWQLRESLADPERRAIVIGAGLAGSAACERLASRGWRITLIERRLQPAQEASGNLAGIYMPLLSKDDNPTARLTRAAYLFSAQLWRCSGGVGHACAGEICGVLQLARDAAHAQVQQEIMERWKYPSQFAQWLNHTEAAGLLGHAVPNGGLLFPQAGWADPGGICRALLARYGHQVDTRFEQSASQLKRSNGQWQVLDANGALIEQAPTVVLANGVDALRFAQTAQLPLAAVRGQVTYVAAEALPTLPVVVCRDGYLTRQAGGMCSVGASYDMDNDTMPRRSSDVENCTRLEQMLPDISINLDRVSHQNRVAFRCVSTDRLPLVGALPDVAATIRGDRLRDVPRLPGLYGLLGYASRGLIWSTLAAELLTAQLEGEPLPLESALVDALDPARFFLQAHRKNFPANG